MLRIRILSVGKTRQNFVLDGEKEYLKRLKSFAKIQILELPAARSSSDPKREEATVILAKINGDNSHTISLDEKGEKVSSLKFSQYIEHLTLNGVSNITFVVGGAFGLSEDIILASSKVLSLSELTFPRQLCRLILIEQLYRALSIIHGTPYHKE